MNAEFEVWKQLRDALRLLRGANRLRGAETHLLEQHQIRIPFEWRGDQRPHSEYIIHLTSDTETLWAERMPDKQRTTVSDFGGDWKKWLEALVMECVGSPYLHTQSAKADYRQVSVVGESTKREI
jgi:hypothetical protein